jgi:transposase
VFQVHGAVADGQVLFRKTLSRPQVARFIADQPPCRVAIKARASAHFWARHMVRHGPQVRLIAPHHVKPVVNRQKTDAADAEAIVEAALRPTMRCVEPKSADQQARAVALRTQKQVVKQRTEAVNALRSHLHEFAHAAPEKPRKGSATSRALPRNSLFFPHGVRHLPARANPWGKA